MFYSKRIYQKIIGKESDYNVFRANPIGILLVEKT